MHRMRRDYGAKRPSRPLVRIGFVRLPVERILYSNPINAAVQQNTNEESILSMAKPIKNGPVAERWSRIARTYTTEDVSRLRGTVQIEYSLARAGAEKLWNLLHRDDYVPALGALTGNQAVEMAAAGLKAIYLSGWQVAADSNLAGQMYPDQSLYPVNSVPALVRGINNALIRADQIALSRPVMEDVKSKIAEARAAWKALADRDGIERRYWKQNDEGRWEQAA